MACVGNLVCRGHVAGLELRIAQQCRITALSYRMLQHECRVNVAVSCTAVCVTLSPPSPTFCTLHAVRTIKSACFSTYLMRVASLLLFLLLLLLLFLFHVFSAFLFNNGHLRTFPNNTFCSSSQVMFTDTSVPPLQFFHKDRASICVNAFRLRASLLIYTSAGTRDLRPAISRWRV